ncbi:FadR/GntR family transcriptional regulator [Ancylomarina sp. 16SWW S1-10-2]|uniref:FadR/GntR family transcriptional regulator n=1 Tax=Ancylomarina sp. 16SWW S1-10-2 TaxID=2499681 RepID=UPI0012AD69B1|nr:FadR/GntR family transcriptional regulator [Ancylomarina sp. 16SWW S1-10-2]MRT94335.1 FadR family transcriptional regulator [Ancylomarina sp. 16SWW S1-10-2]
MPKELFDNLKEIVIEKPADKIADQINELISSGQLKTGDKLPSERFLSEKFNVGRIFVRDAIRKLEFYGIVKTLPQSGTIVTDNQDSAFVGMLANALNLMNPDYKSLMEVRNVLEIDAAGSAAERAQPEDIKLMEEAVNLLAKKVSEGEAGLEEDLLFHVRIAEATKNDVIKYLISYLASHMQTFSKKYDICRNSRNLKALKEHRVILEHIKNGDIEKSRESMKNHLSSLFDFTPKHKS